MNYWYAILIVVVIAVIIYQITSREKRRRAAYLRQITSSWGNVPKREYDYGEIEHIAKYFQKTVKEGEYFVDDITWHDVDMDSVFISMNNCRSSCGDDFLYKMLRMPLLKKADLEERNRVIEFFEKNNQTRINYQLELSKIGRSKKFALIDYVDNLSKQIPESNMKNYLQLGMYVVAIASLFVNIAFGVLLCISVLCYNIYTYYKIKGEIEPYFVSVGAIVRMVSCAEDIMKLNAKDLSEYTERMKGPVKILSSVRKDAKYLGSTDRFSGDIGSMMWDYLNMFIRLDLIKYNTLLGKVQKYRKEILILMEEMGRLDAYISIASYRQVLPFYCIGELEESKTGKIDAVNLYHPLLSEPVANSIEEDRPVLLTGSNASGKSTFLKTVAINAILAQSAGMALAKSYSSNFFRIYSSMALADNLQGSESYFIVEIKSLKRIMDAVGKSEVPVLCFVDEVLRGTNTVERIAASSRILETLAKEGVMCFAATHDIELTHMLEELYSNYHFTEDVKQNDVYFSYLLHKGRATTRNAIKLLGVLGYDQSVIDQAEHTAQEFLKTGEWIL